MRKLRAGKLNGKASCVGVIMAGGSGTRFWPLSRTAFPKQFLPLAGGDETLIQLTAQRFSGLCGEENIVVVTAAHQVELVAQQLPGVSILAEPCARNTAACLGYAAICTLNEVGDLPMICVPADHMIWEVDQLQEIYKEAVRVAAAEDLVATIGIKPTQPETGYGYIECGKSHASAAGAHDIIRFVEKPDRQRAEEYLQNPNFFWNSGMFIVRPSILLKMIGDHLPELLQGLTKLQALFNAAHTKDEQGFIEANLLYQALPAVSFDVAIMEKITQRIMFPGSSFRWSDVGSWSTWADIEMGTLHGEANALHADALLINSKQCAVLSKSSEEKAKFIAGVGLENLIVIETDDALLICHRDHTQDVKQVVEELRKRTREDLL